ncbi:MAG: VCBS repeat-containing protein [Verrucomicrobia bacterium]|nr:VCBS repeat-containing protein [Verrucomicrobiota bacterium]
MLLGIGDGKFQPSVGYHLDNISHVAVADFTGDGTPDLVTIDDASLMFSVVTVWINGCSSGPNIRISRSGDELTVSWPFPSEGYILEKSENLNPTSWKPVDPPPTNRDLRWEFTAPSTQSQGYFRLRKP